MANDPVITVIGNPKTSPESSPCSARVLEGCDQTERHGAQSRPGSGSRWLLPPRGRARDLVARRATYPAPLRGLLRNSAAETQRTEQLSPRSDAAKTSRPTRRREIRRRRGSQSPSRLINVLSRWTICS